MINVLPINDTKEHIENNSCWCNPDVIFENEDIIVIHNSHDLREIIEDVNIFFDNE